MLFFLCFIKNSDRLPILQSSDRLLFFIADEKQHQRIVFSYVATKTAIDRRFCKAAIDCCFLIDKQKLRA
jgi:hypothetical protein